MLASGAISEIALIFVTNEDFDAQINKVLASAGRHLGVSRCYLFLDSADGKTTTNTHEWCAEGIEPQIANWQDIPYSEIPSWRAVLEKESVYAVDDTGLLPVDIKKVLESESILSIILAPIRVGDHVRGFLGFDECAKPRVWSMIEIETLKTIAGIVATAYSRKLLAEQVSASEENFRSLFNTVDDIILIADLEGRLVFANEGASRKLGYSLEEFRGKHILEFHPADKRDEATRILTAMFKKELTHCPLEVEDKKGVRIPVETRIWFGKWDGRDCIFGISKDLSAEQAALQQFERLFRSNPAAMAVSTVNDNRFTDINDSFLRILGYTREEIIGKSSLELGLFIDDDMFLRSREELLRTGFLRNRGIVLRRKDGSLINGLFSGDTIDSQGQKYYLSVMVDITKQVKLQTALETEHNRLANIIEGTKLGTWEWNVQTGETIFNRRWAEIIGYTLDELAPVSIGTWMRLAHPDDLSESDRLLKLHFGGAADYYDCEIRMRHKNGSWVWIHDRGKVIERSADGRPLKMYGTHTDITEKKAMEEQIRELAIRDPLTEVYNRRYIFERLEGLAAEYSRLGRNFCVSILDLDHFKRINDAYGHQTGDFILREFALAVSSAIRQYDLFGRYGGEEFIIISPNAGGAETTSMIERVMGMTGKRPFRFEDRTIQFTFSGGIADSSEFSRNGFQVADMFALADKRLYAAKLAGRNRCVGP